MMPVNENTRASRDWITANKSPPSSLKTDNDDDAEINHYVLTESREGEQEKKIISVSVFHLMFPECVVGCTKE